MGLPNLLASRNGRLAAFFFLYVTEGIPLGFAATAVATQLRRMDVGPAEIGAFVGSFYLPWAFKWAYGPVIDVFSSERFGRRRTWILGTQVLMALTLLATATLELPQQLGLFTLVLLLHNSFGAMQDVAIDALACSTLQAEERGLATGFMFSGATVGQMIGGSGVLYLSGVTGFPATFWFVAGAILLVTALVVWPMQEAAGPPRATGATSRASRAAAELRQFANDAFRSFVGTPGAFGGLLYALLPAGAMCLGLALQSNLSVELGMNDDQVAELNFWSAALGAVFCVVGGYLGDRLGRRRMLALYFVLMSLPVFYLMNELSRHGWIMPVSVNAPNRPPVPPELVSALWVAALTYSVAQGLMYGASSAILMDVTNPAVAATQFTAYMALANLAISYTSTWQGIAVEAWGYPTTMLIDGIFGMACILVIPWLKRSTTADGALLPDGRGPGRARALATGLGLACLAWWPYSVWQLALGAAQPIAGTLFTLIFVASAVFLVVARLMLNVAHDPALRVAPWLAMLLVLMHVRHYLGPLGQAFSPWLDPQGLQSGARFVMLAVAGAGGWLLLRLGRKTWEELHA